MPDNPFEIRHPAEGITVLVFAEDVTERRTEAHEQTLDHELSRCTTLAVDLSATKTMRSQWWRYLGRLGQRGRREGQQVVIVGASPTLRTTADAVAAAEHLEWQASLDAGGPR